MRPPLLVVLLLAGCGDPAPAPAPSPAPTPREQMARTFLQQMKAMEVQLDNLLEDIASGRSEADIRARLDRIRTAAETASRQPYREVPAENRDFELQFETFLSTFRRLEPGPWTGDDGRTRWRALGAACNVCHDLYRRDE